MAVLVEAISVIVRRVRIEESYPGGWDAFDADCPNKTLCADSDIARVGFMMPTDVETFTRKLERQGLVYVNDGKAIDVAVLDQHSGLCVPCDWLEFGHVQLKGNRVAACRAVGSMDNVMITPDGWKYEGSLSQTFGFVPTGQEERSLRFLRHERGVDVFLNLVTGEEVFVGRVGKHTEPGSD
jgi:hypothetical protein